jgi:glycosyltransferase involved in cell wall biosynthesis
MNVKLSIVYATRNEEAHIEESINSVKSIADELIVVDEYSSDKTRELAKKNGAKVYLEPHHTIFHITKQKGINKATGNWILQLDADERVTPELAREILKVINMSEGNLEKYQSSLKEKRLFDKHIRLIEKGCGAIGKSDGDFVAFFIPRKNYFLGKYLRYGGTYPDGVIRLIKKGKAYLPCKDVHEQMKVDGRVGWLQNPLLHKADRTFKRYLERNSRYIDLMVKEFEKEKLEKNIANWLNYMIILPISWFLLTQIRHKGILDGWQGIVFSFFSALRFSRAYIRYLKK